MELLGVNGYFTLESEEQILLISLVPDGWSGDKENIDNLDKEGTFQDTPTLWTLGNYSLFIRPGYRRVSMQMAESRSFSGQHGFLQKGIKWWLCIVTFPEKVSA